MAAPEPLSRKSLFVVVSADPRSSHRAAEAIRLAAGVAAWRKVDVSIYFCGPAVIALNGDPDDFVDEESFTRYLPMLKEFGSSILVEAGATNGRGKEGWQAISTEQLASIAGDKTYLLRF
jgi:hypothetical protein